MRSTHEDYTAIRMLRERSKEQWCSLPKDARFSRTGANQRA